MRRSFVSYAWFVMLGLASACSSEKPPALEPVTEEPAEPVINYASLPTSGSAAPLMGLNQAQTEQFYRGFQFFAHQFTASTEGLGPLYNARSCSQCHNEPLLGGDSVVLVRLAAIHDDAGVRMPPGGPVVYAFSVSPEVAPADQIPEANLVELRKTPTLMGAGLIDAIADADIAAQEQNQMLVLGIQGRASRVIDSSGGVNEIGRFGAKAQMANLRNFVGQALRNEVGITNPVFSVETSMQSGDTLAIVQMDAMAEPEMGTTDFAALVSYTTWIAPPSATSAGTGEGFDIFEAVGCHHCHKQSYMTRTDLVGVELRNQQVVLYSDLLIHDIDTGPGVPQGSAGLGDYRSTPLWGLSQRRALLHDGRVATIEEAIAAHGGEAAMVRDAYNNLSSENRDTLLEFLRGL